MMKKIKDTIAPKKLDDYLRNIPELNDDIEDYTPSFTAEQVVSHTEEHEALYDEEIPNEIAKILLGKNYDPKCHYKMITMQESTVVAKIDDRISEDTPPITDAEGRIIAGHIVEYPLSNDDEEEVMSYKDMLNDVNEVSRPHQFTDHNVYRDVYETKSKIGVGFWIVIILTVLGISVWVFFIWMLKNMGGM